MAFPKPRKPATYASRDVGITIREDIINPFTGDRSSNTYDFSVRDGEGYRSYGSGLSSPYPGWKGPSGYSIYGLWYDRPSGTTQWRWDNGVINRIITGPADSQPQPPYESKFLEPVGYPKGISINDRNRLNTELMQKVGGRSADYGAALGESRETIHHLAKTVTSLAKAAIAAKHGRWGQVAKALGVPKKPSQASKALSARWLEYQFGWKPLMSDIHDTVELFKKGLDRPQLMSSVRNLRDTNHVAYTWGTFGSYSLDEEQGLRAKVYYRVNPSQLSTLHRLGLINPLSVAWELTPYSFVVDWFLPVGNFLEALTARFGVEFIGGYYGNRVVCKQTRREDPDWGYRSECIANTRQTTANRFAYTREVMTGFPVPGLYFKDPFSSTHLLNALALVRQLGK